MATEGDAKVDCSTVSGLTPVTTAHRCQVSLLRTDLGGRCPELPTLCGLGLRQSDFAKGTLTKELQAS